MFLSVLRNRNKIRFSVEYIKSLKNLNVLFYKEDNSIYIKEDNEGLAIIQAGQAIYYIQNRYVADLLRIHFRKNNISSFYLKIKENGLMEIFNRNSVPSMSGSGNRDPYLGINKSRQTMISSALQKLLNFEKGDTIAVAKLKDKYYVFIPNKNNGFNITTTRAGGCIVTSVKFALFLMEKFNLDDVANTAYKLIIRNDPVEIDNEYFFEITYIN